LPWWALGASGMASNTDIAGTMVITALIYSMGVKGFFIEIRGGIVLIMAFFMIFMGKWTRRAQVMTLAEWMRLRFGDGHEGRTARLISALANLVVSIWIISYFAVGGGKFFGMLMGIDDRVASVSLILLTMIYTAASGFYGVVWTDVVQGGLILVAVLYVIFVAMTQVVLPPEFMVSVPDGRGGFEAVRTTLNEWANVLPPMNIDLPGEYSRYNIFGITVFFYLLKTCIEGFAGAGGYTSQRYFAAKSDREAGLLSLFWILLLSFRWPLVMGLAILGIHYGITTGKVIDPELVLPTVIAEYMPAGMKGLVIACFMAAAMSTFTAVINAGAAYWVKDIYETFINPNAGSKTLIWHSRIATVAIVLLGLAFSLDSVNINDIWGWITMAFGTGLFVPLLLRWYWWRYNGYGFAAGTLFGMLSAILIRVLKIDLPEYMSFLAPSGISLVGCVLGTLLTPPTPQETLVNFVKVTRPFGFWGNIAAQLPEHERQAIRTETRRDLAAIVFAVPWQLVLFMLGMVFVLRQWSVFAGLLLAFVALSAGVYWFWFRHLATSEKAEATAQVQQEV
ncbi:MAG: sodium:solute symporter, partial [Proteobacteria bacterium]|nr:sodium:solute symporter [Pseudomonadota bacterium]